MKLHGQRSVRAASVAVAVIGRSGLPRVLQPGIHPGRSEISQTAQKTCKTIGKA